MCKHRQGNTLRDVIDLYGYIRGNAYILCLSEYVDTHNAYMSIAKLVMHHIEIKNAYRELCTHACVSVYACVSLCRYVSMYVYVCAYVIIYTWVG